MKQGDYILKVVLGIIGVAIVLGGLGVAAWLYLRARRSKQRDDELDDQNEAGEGVSGSILQAMTSKKNGFLSLKTPLIGTKG